MEQDLKHVQQSCLGAKEHRINFVLRFHQHLWALQIPNELAQSVYRRNIDSSVDRRRLEELYRFLEKDLLERVFNSKKHHTFQSFLLLFWSWCHLARRDRRGTQTHDKLTQQCHPQPSNNSACLKPWLQYGWQQICYLLVEGTPTDLLHHWMGCRSSDPAQTRQRRDFEQAKRPSGWNRRQIHPRSLWSNQNSNRRLFQDHWR